MQASTELPKTIQGYPDHERHAILLAAVEHENATNPNAHIHVIKAKDLQGFLQGHQRGHLQVIVEKEGHYFTLDILQKGDQKSCIVLDAANDYRCFGTIEELESNGFQVMMASSLDDSAQFEDKNLQADLYNCSMFALDHSIQFARTPDAEALHTQISSNTIAGGFTWECLPLNFLRNTQSATFLQQQMAKPEHAADAETQTYIQKGLITYQNQGQSKVRNDSINLHVFQQAQAQYLKIKILAAMTLAIQEVAHSINPIGKQAKILRLTQIKQAFAQASAGPNPFLAEQVIAFTNEAAQRRGLSITTSSAAKFRAEIQSLRAQQPAAQTVNTAEPSGLDLT